MSDIPRTRRPSGFRISRKLTLTLAIVFALAGALLILFGGPSFLKLSFLEGIGSSILTLGLVTLVTEFFLRTVYTYELIELVELRDHVLDVGFVEAATESKVDWGFLYGDSREIKIVLANPGAWLDREWPMLTAALEKHSIKVLIYLPDRDTEAMMSFGSACFGIEKNDYESSIATTAKKVAEGWHRAKKRPGSNISVFRMTDPTSFSAASFGSTIAYLLHAPATDSSTANLAIRFATDADHSTQKWARNLFESLEARGYELYYEDQPTPSLVERGSLT